MFGLGVYAGLGLGLIRVSFRVMVTLVSICSL